MSDLYDIFCDHPCVSTDTRRITPDSIFFALKGENFDGNLFATTALAKGAAWAVVDDPQIATTDSRMILVNNVLESMQELAREHRRELGLPILAISGSNGKTTTKELVSRVLAENFEIFATHGNLNNHIGVPLTLLSMDRHTEFGIVEMGASAQGEIALLCSIAEPNYGLLTNVGRAHLEGFGGEIGVRKGKGELFDFLAANGGTAFVCDEDKVVCSMAQERESMDVEHYYLELAEGLKNHLEGDYNRFNIAAAVAIGNFFDIDPQRIAHAIESYMPDNNRSQRTQTKRNTLIVDCYNANPSSMGASISNFLAEPTSPPQKKILILGDMLELGEWSQREHTEIIRLATSGNADQILLVGAEFKLALKHIKRPSSTIAHYNSREELESALATQTPSNSLILIKGSRGIGLEKIVSLL